MARAGEIGLTIGMIAVWLADRLHAPELHTERQVRRIRQAAAGGICARLAWAELSAISGLSRSHHGPIFFVEAMCGFFLCCEGYCSAPQRIE
jgi:hypothetical protein